MKAFADKETDFTPEQGLIEGCTKDERSIASDWEPLRELIEGVKVKEMKNVPKENGFLTEIFRADWALDAGEVKQVFQVNLLPGSISAWHAHQFATDRLFASQGLLKVVLFDARANSPTHKLINEFRLSLARPTLIIVPPGVWHGVQNISTEQSYLINLVDRAYAYDDPDHWRLPFDTQQIPYSFTKPTS
jgi:dTDP-4-dehydrorhamnose 3,5-epimerase